MSGTQQNDFSLAQRNWRESLTLILDNPYNKGRSIKKGSAGRALSVFLPGLGSLRSLLSFKFSALAAPLRRSCSALMLAALSASVAAAQLFPPEDATANSADGGEVVDTSDEHNHNVILRVVRVTPDWHGYTISGGWPTAVVVKESEALKYFEVAIWEETKSIHLYEFDNDFDPYSWSSTPEQATAHRESYAIERVPGLPAAGSADTRSLFIKQAFAGFTSYIVSRYPDSEHHLIYSGHGGPGGLLFDAQLLYQDANDMLAHWTYRLGRPLGGVWSTWEGHAVRVLSLILKTSVNTQDTTSHRIFLMEGIVSMTGQLKNITKLNLNRNITDCSLKLRISRMRSLAAST